MSEVIKAIDLMITNACNLKCSYCYHHQNPDTMTLDSGKKVLDRLKELYPNFMRITFFGGEPMLFPETVLGLAKYANELWKNVPSTHATESRYTICTNGTYFDTEFFKEWAILHGSVQVSIDGDQIGMKNRTTDKEQLFKIYDNVANMHQYILDTYLSCRLTFTPENVNRLATNIRFIVEMLKIKSITHHAVMEADWDETALNLYRGQLSLLYQYRRFLKKHNESCKLTFIDKTLSIIDGNSPMDTNYCGAGKEYVAIQPNGDVYPCHRAASQGIFKLGNIFDEVPIIRGIFSEIDKVKTGCMSSCPAARTCHSCPITHFKVNNDLYKPIEKYCHICRMEDYVAEKYIPTEVGDAQSVLMGAMAKVVADLSEQVQDIIKKK